MDMINNLQKITVDVATKTVWVQAGATLGELYYAISQKSTTLAFPGGICPTVGIGGYVSDGGYGNLSRIYSLATDNVVDAIFVDAKGRTQTRFTDLGLVKSDCTEMSWIESTVHFARFPKNTSPEILLNRTITLLTGTAKYKGNPTTSRDPSLKSYEKVCGRNWTNWDRWLVRWR
ncbi:O-acetylstemmadenine oxidase [Linum grandiflorum]